MLNPTQESIRQSDDEVTNEMHASPDRSIVGPYEVEMPEPRD